MGKGKRVVSKEDSEVDYPSGELKARKKGSKLTNGGGKKQEEAASAASKKAAAKKRTRKPSSQMKNIWVASFVSFVTAAIVAALVVYNWSFHDSFDLTKFWTDNEERIYNLVEHVTTLFAQQLGGGDAAANATTDPVIETMTPPPTTA
ncbi:uncharacterized protein LOC132192618 [Neocloeon triangulifer]|uniref:uncharacterized protein LOC132192618 n=1 Tax=Neocloeon triangulifer TaxID=2078957 RepID=UPI00286ED20D|nr:uncharacterized protein LOC132192618 [Neocloeon triangulifer]